jgi:hypothetical protein
MAKDNTPNLFGIEEVEEVNIGSVIRVSFETGVDSEFDYNLPFLALTCSVENLLNHYPEGVQCNSPG